MFLELTRSALRADFSKLRQQSLRIEGKIDTVAGSPERDINRTLYDELGGYKGNLGNVQLKGQTFKVSIDVERQISHGKLCHMILPSRELTTELGDLIIAVDHILEDFNLPDHKKKIVGGTCSIVQTKKESLAKKGLTARQLYLMTQWPRFRYRDKSWDFKLLPDTCSFYLFVLDPASPKRKTNLLSSPLLLRLINADKTTLLNNIEGTIGLPRMDIISRENDDKLPFSLASFLTRSLYLSIGSQSIDLRNFLRETFFGSMEEVEDCLAATQTVKQTPDFGKWSPGITNQTEVDDDIFAVRMKVILRRID